MGCDMNVYLVSKPKRSSEELSRLGRDGLMKAGYAVCYADKLPPNFKPVRHMHVTIELDKVFINWSKIKEDFKLPLDARLERYVFRNSGETVESDFTYYGGERYRIEFSSSKYQYHKRIPAYCTALEELAHWKNNFDLFGDMCACSNGAIENSGLYPMNWVMLNVVAVHDPEAFAKIRPYVGDRKRLLAFSAWY